jgi:proteic killer suppression protein
MITSIYHKGLKRFWTKGDPTGLPSDKIRKIRKILELLDSAEKVSDLNFPGAGLHPLKSDLKNYWSVTVKENWRIIFRFEDGNVFLVDSIDYH